MTFISLINNLLCLCEDQIFSLVLQKSLLLCDESGAPANHFSGIISTTGSDCETPDWPNALRCRSTLSSGDADIFTGRRQKWLLKQHVLILLPFQLSGEKLKNCKKLFLFGARGVFRNLSRFFKRWICTKICLLLLSSCFVCFSFC